MTKKKEKKIDLKTKITKQNLFYLLIATIDIVFIIYAARHNYANYATIPTKERFFVGDSKDLIFGKNFITLIFSAFIYIYLLLSNKIFFNIKHTKKNMVQLFLLIFIINIIIFFIFTKRIY